MAKKTPFRAALIQGKVSDVEAERLVAAVLRVCGFVVSVFFVDLFLIWWSVCVFGLGFVFFVFCKFFFLFFFNFCFRFLGVGLLLGRS